MIFSRLNAWSRRVGIGGPSEGDVPSFPRAVPRHFFTAVNSRVIRINGRSCFCFVARFEQPYLLCPRVDPHKLTAMRVSIDHAYSPAKLSKFLILILLYSPSISKDTNFNDELTRRVQRRVSGKTVFGDPFHVIDSALGKVVKRLGNETRERLARV